VETEQFVSDFYSVAQEAQLPQR